MAKNPRWMRSFSEVIQHPTTQIIRKSVRTGNSYNVDVVPSLELTCMGNPEMVDKEGVKSYRYSVFDSTSNLEYTVSCPNKLEINGIKQVILTNLTGGSLPNGRSGWYKADSIKLAGKKEGSN